MSASKPGRTRRFFGGIWRFLDASRRVVLNLIFVAIVVLIVMALVKSGPPALREQTALVLDLNGTVGEQRTGNLRATALDQVRGETTQKIQLRDVLAVLDTAAADSDISSVLLVLDRFQGTGFATLREIGAALDRFKASGKKVVAWGSNYDQLQYYVAVHADEVLLHPFGEVLLKGFGSLRNYYKDALDKAGVTVNLVRVGTYKSFGEPYIANAPSDAALEADRALYGSLWQTYTSAVEQRRKLAPGAIMKLIDAAPERLAAAGGDAAKLALAERQVDALKTRDELRQLMMQRGAVDAGDHTFRQVSFDAYLGRIKTKGIGDAVGIVVAEGEIVDGTAPAGTVGGVSTANLVRKAREDKDVKAIVLRVDSPGGSVFGSELVRRELELARQGGKPVVVSMGDVAASGGYWIATASDEIVADAATVTGSIGVFALLPNGADTLAKLGVHPAGVATTWLRNAGDPRLPLDPRAEQLVQLSIDDVYAKFTQRVATARKLSRESVEAVAEGRVWTGLQAKERGLVDRIGLLDDAVASAAKRGGLGAKPRTVYIEREPSPFARFVSTLNAQVGGWVDAAIDARIGSLGIPPSITRDAQRDLGWLASIAERKKPFEAVIHCLCSVGL